MRTDGTLEQIVPDDEELVTILIYDFHPFL